MQIKGFDSRPHYVYMLVDPRDEEVFYVGKGQGGRLHFHSVEAAAHDPDDEEQSSRKIQRINELRSTGELPSKRIVGRFQTAAEAYAVEATLIHWMYGKSNLTNVQSGHSHRFIRRKGDLEERDRLEREPRVGGPPSGDFTARKLAAYRTHDIGYRLKTVATDLLDLGYSCSRPKMERQDAQLSVVLPEFPNLCLRLVMSMTEAGNIQSGLAPQNPACWQEIARLHDQAVARGGETTPLPSHRLWYVPTAFKGNLLSEHEVDVLAARTEWCRAFANQV